MASTPPNESELSDLVALADSAGGQPLDLDELVHEAASSLAASINHGGRLQQVAFLVEQLGEAAVREQLAARTGGETDTDDRPYFVVHHRWDLNCKSVFHLSGRNAAERRVLTIIAEDLHHLSHEDAAEIAQVIAAGKVEQAVELWHAAQGQQDRLEFGPISICIEADEVPDVSEFLGG